MGLIYTISNVVSGPLAHQYLADQIPGWYHSLLRDCLKIQEPTKGELIISSEFDVYLLDRETVAFVRSPCKRENVDLRFNLRVYPVEGAGRTHDTFDLNVIQGTGFHIGETCVTSRALPGYAVGRLRVGQFNHDRSGHTWMRSYYSKEYKDRLLLGAGDPIIRSNFDVFVMQNKVIY